MRLRRYTPRVTSEDASRRLARDGPNELRSAPTRPAWRRVLSQFQDPLVYLLLAAVAVSLGAWMIEGTPGWPVDAIVIALVVVLNAVLGYLQEAKAENAVAALARMTAVTSAVLRDGQVVRVPSAELVLGMRSCWAFNARSETASAFGHLFANRRLWGTVALSVGLQVAVVHLAFLNAAFGTVPLEPGQWLACAAMASVVLWFRELRKLVNHACRAG